MDCLSTQSLLRQRAQAPPVGLYQRLTEGNRTEDRKSSAYLHAPAHLGSQIPLISVYDALLRTDFLA